MTDTSLITFKAISNFTTCLEEVFGEEQKSLKLYAHLINKTTLAHEKPILKHMEAFRKFCVENRDALEQKDHTKLVSKNISYSNRVYINIFNILDIADTETKSIIWKHLLTISVLVDPTWKAREVLKQGIKDGSELDFLQNIIDKVEQNVDPNSNPLEAVNSIMKSGVFQELVGGLGNGLKNGNLDLNKLMGSVQSLVGNLSENDDENNPMNLVSNMMSNLNLDNNDGTPPDLNHMMSMMGPMLNSLGNLNMDSTQNTNEALSIENNPKTI